MPRVSVVIPAWNAEPFIERAVRSALAQTEVSVEVVVVDDGSTDATGRLCAALAAADARVLHLHHAQARGPSAARNTALAAASGDWVALLDADDQQESERLAALVGEAERRGLDVLADNLVLCGEHSGARLGLALDPERMRTRGLLSLQELLESDWPGRRTDFRGLGLAKPIFRRAFIEQRKLRYDERVRLGEDLLFYAQALIAGAAFGLTPRCGYLYTVRQASISHRKQPTTELVEVNDRIRSIVLEKDPSSPLLDLLERREAALRFQVFSWALKTRHLTLAGRMAKRLGARRLLEGLRDLARRKSPW